MIRNNPAHDTQNPAGSSAWPFPLSAEARLKRANAVLGVKDDSLGLLVSKKEQWLAALATSCGVAVNQTHLELLQQIYSYLDKNA